MTSEPGPARADDLPIRLSQDPAADALLARNPFALLVGMLLDQQFPMERAFAGPYVLSGRLGHDLTVGEIATIDPDLLKTHMTGPPAVHRFPGAMARRTQSLAQHVATHYGGDPTLLWREISTGDALRERIAALPGFGKQKAKILVALLGKQFGVTPEGWREAAGEYGAEGTRLSIADVTDPESLAEVRQQKRERKAAAKSLARSAGKNDRQAGSASADRAGKDGKNRRRRTADGAPGAATAEPVAMDDAAHR